MWLSFNSEVYLTTALTHMGIEYKNEKQLTWIGLRKPNYPANATWAWTDGSVVNYLNWGHGKPEDITGLQNCAQVRDEDSASSGLVSKLLCRCTPTRWKRTLLRTRISEDGMTSSAQRQCAPMCARSRLFTDCTSCVQIKVYRYKQRNSS